MKQRLEPAAIDNEAQHHQHDRNWWFMLAIPVLNWLEEVTGLTPVSRAPAGSLEMTFLMPPIMR